MHGPAVKGRAKLRLAWSGFGKVTQRQAKIVEQLLHLARLAQVLHLRRALQRLGQITGRVPVGDIPRHHQDEEDGWNE